MFKKKTLTDDEKYMLEQTKLDRELVILKRQFLGLDLNKYYTGKGSRQLLATTKVISIFYKEHRNLVDDLTRARDPGRVKEDEKTFNYLSYLVDEEFVQLSEQVANEKRYMLELEGEMKTVKKSVNRLKSLMVTDRQYEEHVMAAQVTLECLENKLETQLIKFGTICSKNRLLREQIDHCIVERRNFMNIFGRLIGKLSEGKKIMLDLIEQATVAFNQREEWCNKLQALRISANQDLQTNRQEMREYARKRDNIAKLREFFDVKGRKRLLADLQRKFNENKQKQKEKLEETISNYRRMFAEISEFINDDNVKQIAKKVIIREADNFSHLTFIMDAIRDMDLMNEELGPLHIEIEDRTILHQERSNKQKQKTGELEARAEGAKAEATEAEEKLQQLSDTLTGLIQGVESLFKMCRCDKDPIVRLLGDQTHVTSHNILLFVNVLEDRVHRLLVEANFKDKSAFVKMGKKKSSGLIVPPGTRPKIYSIDRIVKTTPCSLCMEHELVADVIDNLQHVLTRDKARARLRFKLKVSEGFSPCHNLSSCQLPKSRQMQQKRYE